MIPPRRFNSFTPEEIAKIKVHYDAAASLLKASRAAGVTHTMLRRIRDAQGWALKCDQYGRPIGDNHSGYFSMYDAVETGK
jgi:hypothetical protein